MQRPRHRYQAKSLRFSQRRYELQNRPCRIRLFSEKQIGPINRWGHGLLHGTNHGVKDSNFESKIPSGFYGSFTKTRSQKCIYIVIVVHRDQTSKKQKKPKPSRLCFAFEKPFPKAFDLKKKSNDLIGIYIYIYFFNLWIWSRLKREKKKIFGLWWSIKYYRQTVGVNYGCDL